MNNATALNSTFNTVTAGDLYYLDKKGVTISVETERIKKSDLYSISAILVNRVAPSFHTGGSPPKFKSPFESRPKESLYPELKGRESPLL